MTDTDPDTAGFSVEDIEGDVDTVSARLDREADAILASEERRAFAPRPLRRAVREDAVLARNWGRHRAEHLREAVETEPVKATLYALGIGVIIGLLAAR